MGSPPSAGKKGKRMKIGKEGEGRRMRRGREGREGKSMEGEKKNEGGWGWGEKAGRGGRDTAAGRGACTSGLHRHVCKTP